MLGGGSNVFAGEIRVSCVAVLLPLPHSFVAHSQLDKGSLRPICQAAYLIYVYRVYLCDEDPKEQMLHAAVIAVTRPPQCLPSSINILLALSGTAHSENWGSPKTRISSWREQFAHNISSVKTNKQQRRNQQKEALLGYKHICLHLLQTFPVQRSSV